MPFRSETCTVLSLVDVDEASGMSHWTLADVRANHQAAGAFWSCSQRLHRTVALKVAVCLSVCIALTSLYIMHKQPVINRNSGGPAAYEKP